MHLHQTLTGPQAVAFMLTLWVVLFAGTFLLRAWFDRKEK
jgi:hypothetical protein